MFLKRKIYCADKIFEFRSWKEYCYLYLCKWNIKRCIGHVHKLVYIRIYVCMPIQEQTSKHSRIHLAHITVYEYILLFF